MTEPAPYVDDLAEVVGTTSLIRRLPAAWFEWVDDGTSRVTSGAMQFLSAERALAFDCPGPGLSVIASPPADEAALIERYHVGQGDGLAYLDETLLRERGGCGVHVRPRDDEPDHAVVFSLDPTKRDLPKGVKRELAKFATKHLIVPPRR